MYRKIAGYVSLSVLGMIGVSIYILADTYFISWGFGSDGLAVLNLTLPVYGLIYAMGQMIGLGFAVIYSLEKAKGKEIDFYFCQAISWCILFSIPIVLLGILAPDQVLRLLGADPALAEMGKDYLRLILCGSPLFMSNYVFTAFARNDHAIAYAMAGALAGSTYNIIFDYVYMFPMGLGFTGAALATVGCPAISILICLAHFRSRKSQVKFRWKKPGIPLLLKGCSLGMSGFVGEFSNAVTSAVFNFLMLGLAGNVGVAAYGVIANIALVCICIFNGIAQGMQPLISRAYGRGKAEETRRLLRTGLLLSVTVAGVFVLSGFAFAGQMVDVFNSQGDGTMAGYAVEGLKLYFLGFLGAGVNVMLIAYYSAIGEAGPVMIGSLMRGLVLITLFSILFGALWGRNGVWLSYLAAELVTMGIIFIISRKRERK